MSEITLRSPVPVLLSELIGVGCEVHFEHDTENRPKIRYKSRDGKEGSYILFEFENGVHGANSIELSAILVLILKSILSKKI